MLKFYKKYLLVGVLEDIYCILTAVFLTKAVNLEIGVLYLSISQLMCNSNNFLSYYWNKLIERLKISLVKEFWYNYIVMVSYTILALIGIIFISIGNMHIGAWLIYISIFVDCLYGITGMSANMNLYNLMVRRKSSAIKVMQRLRQKLGGGIYFLTSLVVVLYNTFVEDWKYLLIIGVMFKVGEVLLTPWLIRRLSTLVDSLKR